MNLKQILKTVVRALMTVVAVRCANAQEQDSNFEYMTTVMCPHPEPYHLKPISGEYFLERGLWWENATSIIDGVEWKMTDCFANTFPLISPKMDYSLDRYNNPTRKEIVMGTPFSETNMEILARRIDTIPSQFANMTSEIRCTYQNMPADRSRFGISKFTLAAQPTTIYHNFLDGSDSRPSTTANPAFSYNKVGEWGNGGVVSFQCAQSCPEPCKVAASFKRFPKKAKPTFFKTASPKPTPSITAKPNPTASMCLVL